MFSLQLLTSFDLKTDVGKAGATEAQEEYSATYSAEIHLNEAFHAFVSNYRCAYEGPNTAAAQIGSPYDTGSMSESRHKYVCGNY